MNRILKPKTVVPIIVVFVALAVFGLFIRKEDKTIADCRQVPVSEAPAYPVRVSDEGFEQTTGEFEQCSVLLITNEASQTIRLAFGEHDNHIHYPEFSETELSPGELKEITLSEYGSFVLHNHYDESQRIDFLVVKDEQITQYDSLQDAVPYDTENHESENHLE